MSRLRHRVRRRERWRATYEAMDRDELDAAARADGFPAFAVRWRRETIINKLIERR